RRPRHDRCVRDAPARGSGYPRGPRRPDRRRSCDRGCADERDQGDDRPAHNPRDAAGSTARGPDAAWRRERRPPRRDGDPLQQRRRPGVAGAAGHVSRRARNRAAGRRSRAGLPRADQPERVPGTSRGGSEMKTSTFVRYELIRNFRNRRFFMFTVGFPLVLYLLIATPNRHEHDLAGSGISAPLYFMVGLAALGTMNAVVGGGARIAFERVSGWTRQLRLTPLRPRAYLGTKVAAGYLSASLTLAPLYAA